MDNYLDKLLSFNTDREIKLAEIRIKRLKEFFTQKELNEIEKETGENANE